MKRAAASLAVGLLPWSSLLCFVLQGTSSSVTEVLDVDTHMPAQSVFKTAELLK